MYDKLIEDFPELYQHCWEFPGEGWEPIIRKLSEKLSVEIGPEKDTYYAVQVKEKFGTLRFYLSSYTDEMCTLINAAEAESAVTCEVCGEPGTRGGKGWIKTACPLHK